ncbi:YkgJ family cysteine cluster protein [Rubrivirga sp. IMCC45206]|uniref:YkgJ family cysteine cluster protein n=1 Tax=Rubrivirga sp. IMCC45206 TaxID=3391614 RepID=UPI00398FE7C3
MTGPTLRSVARGRSDAFAYTCHGCARCCHHKGIRVGPYEAARLAAVLGTTTTAVLARDVDPASGTLRQRDDGACVYLAEGRCTVHAGRPLACRLYPLGWVGTVEDAEVFVELAPLPESAGQYGGVGTVAAYLDHQGTAPYERRAADYAAVARRVAAALAIDGPDPGPPPPFDDIDAALGDTVLGDVEARTDRHLALLHRWLDAAGAPLG